MQTILNFFLLGDIGPIKHREQKHAFFKAKSVYVPRAGDRMNMSVPRDRIATMDHTDYDRYQGDFIVARTEMTPVFETTDEKAEFPVVKEMLVNVYIRRPASFEPNANRRQYGVDGFKRDKVDFLYGQPTGKTTLGLQIKNARFPESYLDLEDHDREALLRAVKECGVELVEESPLIEHKDDGKPAAEMERKLVAVLASLEGFKTDIAPPTPQVVLKRLENAFETHCVAAKAHVDKQGRVVIDSFGLVDKFAKSESFPDTMFSTPAGLKNIIAKLARTLRLSKGIPCMAVTKATGYSASLVSDMELGKADMRMKYLDFIANHKDRDRAAPVRKELRALIAELSETRDVSDPDKPGYWELPGPWLARLQKLANQDVALVDHGYVPLKVTTTIETAEKVRKDLGLDDPALAQKVIDAVSDEDPEWYPPESLNRKPPEGETIDLTDKVKKSMPPGDSIDLGGGMGMTNVGKYMKMRLAGEPLPERHVRIGGKDTAVGQFWLSKGGKRWRVEDAAIRYVRFRATDESGTFPVDLDGEHLLEGWTYDGEE